MRYKGLELGFIQRTLYYGAAGLLGVGVDTILFLLFTSFYEDIPIVLVNVATYSSGTLSSYAINKRFSFRSQTHRLSLRRFLLASLFGMSISTSILYTLVKLHVTINLAKLLATAIAVLVQYAVNSRFSLVSKSDQ